MEGRSVAEILAHHIIDVSLLKELGITKHVVILWIVAIVLVGVMIYAARRIEREK